MNHELNKGLPSFPNYQSFYSLRKVIKFPEGALNFPFLMIIVKMDENANLDQKLGKKVCNPKFDQF